MSLPPGWSFDRVLRVFWGPGELGVLRDARSWAVVRRSKLPDEGELVACGLPTFHAAIEYAEGFARGEAERQR